jgi:hypothetical protein
MSELIDCRISELEILVDKLKANKKIGNNEYKMLREHLKFIKDNYNDNEDVDGNVIKLDKETEKKIRSFYKDLMYLFYDNREMVSANMKKIIENVKEDIDYLDI